MAATASRALNGWHPGEVAVQSIMGLPARVDISAIVNHLPDQHRLFHSTRLPFLPVTTLDEHGRPWVSILTSKEGKPQFITSPTSTKLQIRAHTGDSDPIIHNLTDVRGRFSAQKALISAIGIELSTRRRNKFAGHVADATLDDKTLTLDLNVNQALGLCPKYINVRKLEPYLHAAPQTTYERRELQSDERLPQDVIDFINNADTAYIGTSYVARPEDEEKLPSHVGTNHRGGRPGFVRVRPADGRTLVLPNYNGNRLLNSMGNIQVTPLAALAFPSFTDGSILYVTGDAQNLFGKPARAIMPDSNVVVTIRATGYIFVRNTLPLRQAPNSTVGRSPYCPPVRYLAEETPPEDRYDDIALTFKSARIHTDTLCTFTLEASRPVDIPPSHNAVLDLKHLVHVKSHEIIDWIEGPDAENDECVRTWTVSIYPTEENPRRFSITVRQIKDGLVTPIMYRIVHKVSDGRGYNQEIPLSHLNITARLRGIGGDLPVPHPIPSCDGGRRLLWVAGGIGITPFLGLSRYVGGWVAAGVASWDIILVLSTKEPETILMLITEAFQAAKGTPQAADFSYSLYLFTQCPETVVVPESWPSTIKLHLRSGRLPNDGSLFSEFKAKEREPHVCGPLPFITNAMEGMKNAGVDPEKVIRERFTY